MAAGRPRVRVEGPVPSAPTRGLLAVAPPVDLGEGARELNGIAIDVRPCGCASVWSPDCDAPEVKPGDAIPDDASATPEFDPFTVIHPDACSSFGIGPLDHFTNRARQVFDASEPQAIEHEFWTGTLLPGNPHLASSDAVDVTPDLSGVVDALAALEQEIAASCRQGVIHVTPATAVWLARFNLLASSGQRMVTPTGTPVAVGAGYPGTGPDGLIAPEGAAWMYATGPVAVYRGPVSVLPEQASQALDRSINRFVYRVERDVLVAWDLCLHAAALAYLGSDIPVGS